MKFLNKTFPSNENICRNKTDIKNNEFIFFLKTIIKKRINLHIEGINIISSTSEKNARKMQTN